MTTGPGVVVLDEGQLEELARLVADRLAGQLEQRRADGGLVTAGELAERLGVDRDFVYEHATRLGAVRLGAGPKARLRFDLGEAEKAITCLSSRGSQAPDPAPALASRPRRRRRSGTTVDLLPIRGRKVLP